MTQAAVKLAGEGFTLRSGGAKGADQAFEMGARSCGVGSEIFRPNDAHGDHAAHALGLKYHPAWIRLPTYHKLLHARNGYIVLGRGLGDPVQFLICWTRNASAQGGTGQAIRIAHGYKIPVLDLGDPQVLNRALKWLGRDERVTLF